MIYCNTLRDSSAFFLVQAAIWFRKTRTAFTLQQETTAPIKHTGCQQHMSECHTQS